VRDAHRAHGDDIQREINCPGSAPRAWTTSATATTGCRSAAAPSKAPAKHMVAARMKGSGMTWALAGVRHMLQLRGLIMSSRYARDHLQSLPASPQPAQLLAAA